MNPKAVGTLVKEAFSRWGEDNASRLAAALAYYTLFSLAPLLIIVVVVAGQVFSQAAVKAQILGQIQNTLGPSGANLVQTMIEDASKPGSGIVATIISVITTLLGSMGVFGQLHGSLNTIWGIEPKSDRGLWGMVHDRGLAFVMVLGIGVLFLLLLALSTALSVAQKYLGGYLPGAHVFWQGINFFVPLAIMTLLIAMVYKVLPDAIVAWRDIWLGALLTALLMTIGNFLIGLYLGRTSAGSAYGAAGSLVALLIWIYYSAQVFLFGAELTRVYANNYGSSIRPATNAVRVFRETREQKEGRTPQGGSGADASHGPASSQEQAENVVHSQAERSSDSLAILLLIVATVAAIVAGIARRPRSD